MSGFSIPRHENRSAALIVAVAAHAGLLALLILAPSQAPSLPIGSSVPINIVSSAPFTDTRPAEQAPQTETASTPTPQPKAAPQPPAPEIAPTPSFSHVATAAPKTAKPVTTQPSTHPTQAASSNVDWNRMQQIIDTAKRNAGSQASSASKGPSHVETAQQTRPNAGQGISMSDQLGLQQLLERLWNPNCDAPGGSAVKLKVRFIVGLSGRLLGAPDAGGLESSSNPVMAAAARRAIDAVREAEPYSEPYYGQTITVNFDAKEACAKR